MVRARAGRFLRVEGADADEDAEELAGEVKAKKGRPCEMWCAETNQPAIGSNQITERYTLSSYEIQPQCEVGFPILKH